jgi:hypothetical protein
MSELSFCLPTVGTTGCRATIVFTHDTAGYDVQYTLEVDGVRYTCEKSAQLNACYAQVTGPFELVSPARLIAIVGDTHEVPSAEFLLIRLG